MRTTKEITVWLKEPLLGIQKLFGSPPYLSRSISTEEFRFRLLHHWSITQQVKVTAAPPTMSTMKVKTKASSALLPMISA
jgi:hypothetical protein